MSRYYDCYDKDGEPVSIVPCRAEPPTLTVAAKSEAVAIDFDDADRLYEDLRWKGKTHVQARAAVRERFKV